MYKTQLTNRARSFKWVGPEGLDGAAALMMAMQRHWDEPNREARLALTLATNRQVWADIQDALADGSLSLPLEAQQNLLILSVYANGKLDECESDPSPNRLASLIALTRNLAGSLRDWKVAA